MRENRKWSVCKAAILDFPAKQKWFWKSKKRVILKIQNLKRSRLIFLDISIRSRDMRENRTWSVCKAAILKFPAKQDIVFKIKEMCHLENTKPEKNPFNFLRYFF